MAVCISMGEMIEDAASEEYIIRRADEVFYHAKTTGIVNYNTVSWYSH